MKLLDDSLRTRAFLEESRISVSVYKTAVQAAPVDFEFELPVDIKSFCLRFDVRLFTCVLIPLLSCLLKSFVVRYAVVYAVTKSCGPSISPLWITE